jgi:hypothetical protein
MNLVLDDAEELSLKKKSRKQLGAHTNAHGMHARSHGVSARILTRVRALFCCVRAYHAEGGQHHADAGHKTVRRKGGRRGGEGVGFTHAGNTLGKGGERGPSGGGGQARVWIGGGSAAYGRAREDAVERGVRGRHAARREDTSRQRRRRQLHVCVCGVSYGNCTALRIAPPRASLQRNAARHDACASDASTDESVKNAE